MSAPPTPKRTGMPVASFQRPADWYVRRPGDPGQEGTRLYIVSYLLTRTVVGVLGLLLPIVLLVGEAFFLDQSVRFRGSISAYYHSPMRDVFVAILCVIGFLLMTYMAGQRNADFWISLVAGAAAVGVAMFPTDRPDLPAGAALCGTSPEPGDCAPVQRLLGEATSAHIHYTCAGIFFVCLAVLSFIFGIRETRYNNKPKLALVHYACGSVITLSLVLIGLGEIFGFRFGPVAPLYLGELLAVFAFASSWLVKGWDLRKVLFGGTPAPKATQAAP